MTSPMSGNARQPGRSVVSKISSILAAVRTDGGQTLTQVAAVSRLPMSTVHRLATELVDWQVLDRDEAGRFRLGPALRPTPPDEHGLSPDELRARAAPLLADLVRVTCGPVRMGHLDLTRVAYVQKLSDAHPVTRHVPAAQLPAHATAMGKVLLAYAGRSVVDAVVRAGLPAFTPRTVADPERLRTELQAVRTRGLAACDGELDPAWAALAVPVFGAGGAVVAAIEARVPDLRGDLSGPRSALVVGACCLSRDLAARAAPASVTLRPVG